MQREDAGRCGFSLVEVLVVMAVVTVLTGLLLPAISGVRGLGRRSVCASNARQLVLASAAYADDWRDRCAPGAADILENLHRWHGSRESPSAPFLPGAGSLSSYIGEEELAGADAAAVRVRTCPEFAATIRALSAARMGFEMSCGGYGYNNAYAGVTRTRVAGGGSAVVTDRAGAPLSAFLRPPATAAFADAAFATDLGVGGVIEYSFIEPRRWPHDMSQRADPSIHFRHSGGAVVGWLDGHADVRTLSDSWSSGIYGVDAATVGIGWFGSGTNNEDFDYD